MVTAFVAISIPDLKEDQGERSAQLLERISMQLSIAPGTLNASLLPSPPQFTVDIEDVRINVLWVISLTLSLMAAFFTITAQQWIRHLPLPRQMSIQDAVRLRQFRHDGMVKWQIPTIISLLPVLVQLSVICFLAGLLLYLRSINQTVAVIFAAITGPLVFCFVIASLCPIIWPSCPYKSPLIPTIWTLVQWCIVPILVAGGVLICALLLVILATVSIFWYIAFARFSIFKLIQKPLNDFASWYNVLQDEVTVRLYHIAQRISSGPLHYDTEHFWTSREWAAIRKCPNLIDVLAFAWAPIGVPTNRLKDVALCLRDLPKSERVRSALRWASLELDCFPFDFNMWFSMQYPFHPHILSFARRQSFLRLQAVLMAAFAPDPPGIDENISYNWTHIGGPVQPMSALACCFLIGPNQDRGDASGASALALLYRTTTELQPDELAGYIAKDEKHKIAQTNRNEALESFTRTVMGLRRCQSTDSMADLHWRWPTVFLYLCAERNFMFEEDGTSTSFSTCRKPYLISRKTCSRCSTGRRTTSNISTRSKRQERKSSTQHSTSPSLTASSGPSRPRSSPSQTTLRRRSRRARSSAPPSPACATSSGTLRASSSRFLAATAHTTTATSLASSPRARSPRSLSACPRCAHRSVSRTTSLRTPLLSCRLYWPLLRRPRRTFRGSKNERMRSLALRLRRHRSFRPWLV